VGLIVERARKASMPEADRPCFEAFVNDTEPRLRHALIAACGFQRGREATAEALAWAWENWDRLMDIENKVAYLFRVGQSRSRHRPIPVTFVRTPHEEPWFEPALGPALNALSERQRLAVVLVHGFSWTLKEVAELTGTRVTTVQTHLERGLQHLRASMEVTDHA
jgi:DNA-directed RNA polymerase specialized sigma24 family protein